MYVNISPFILIHVKIRDNKQLAQDIIPQGSMASKPTISNITQYTNLYLFSIFRFHPLEMFPWSYKEALL